MALRGIRIAEVGVRFSLGPPTIFWLLRKMKRQIKILFLLIIPLVLALPSPPPPFHIDQIKIELQKGESTRQEKFRFLTNNDALGTSLLSAILSIDAIPMPGYICLRNTSEIFTGNEKLTKADLLEDNEGGAISIPLFLDEGIISEIYIPYGETTCVSPQAKRGFAELDNKVEVRGFYPWSKPELKIVNGEPIISLKEYPDFRTVFKMEGKKGYDWQWSVYLKNFFLFLIGWIILLSSALQVCHWIREKEEINKKRFWE